MISPFHGHSITSEGSACYDCHRQGGDGNANIEEYNRTGKIVVTQWDSSASGLEQLVGPSGVIPVPPDWRESLSFAYLDYTGAATQPIDRQADLPLWKHLKDVSDGAHIVFGAPLTERQMRALIEKLKPPPQRRRSQEKGRSPGQSPPSDGSCTPPDAKLASTGVMVSGTEAHG